MGIFVRTHFRKVYLILTYLLCLFLFLFSCSVMSTDIQKCITTHLLSYIILRISWQLHHKCVQSKFGKSLSCFIRQIAYVSTINFLFNQEYLHYYLLLWFLIRSYWSFWIPIIEYVLLLYLPLWFENSFHLCHSIRFYIFSPYCYL